MTLRIEFMGRKSEPKGGWLLLGLGLVCLSASSWYYFQARAQRLAEQHEVDRQTELALVEQAKLASLKIDTGPNYLADKRWHHAATDLALPWARTLKALDSATKPPVFLTAFKSDPATGALVLEAEAPSFDDVVHYVRTLNQSEGLISARLLSHDLAQNAQGASSLKFVVQTQWVRQP